MQIQAQRDAALLKLQRARTGASLADGGLQEARAQEDEGDVPPPGVCGEEDAEVDDVVKRYLNKIARLEREVKHLKQVRPSLLD
jgi:hypothetical protein